MTPKGRRADMPQRASVRRSADAHAVAGPHSTDFTISSMTFFASPNTIIVLSI